MLLDMEMPEMNGIEVLIAKNTVPKLKEVPTIVISATEQVDLAVKCIEAGAEDYLLKPPNNTLLRARVTTSLEKNAFATWTAFFLHASKRKKSWWKSKRKNLSIFS